MTLLETALTSSYQINSDRQCKRLVGNSAHRSWIERYWTDAIQPSAKTSGSNYDYGWEKRVIPIPTCQAIPKVTGAPPVC